MRFHAGLRVNLYDVISYTLIGLKTIAQELDLGHIVLVSATSAPSGAKYGSYRFVTNAIRFFRYAISPLLALLAFIAPFQNVI